MLLSAQAPLSSLILLCVVPFFEPVFSLPWKLSMEAVVSAVHIYNYIIYNIYM